MFILSTVVLLQLGPAPARPNEAAPPVVMSAEPHPAGIAGRDYRIGAGDVLRVSVYGHDDLTQTVSVQPSGSIVLPLIGPVKAAEATPAELEAGIAGELAKGLIRDAKVAVVVQEYRSKVVFVVGEVARPGTYPMAGDTSVVEILARAGPLSANAGSELLVVRAADRASAGLTPAKLSAGTQVAPRGEVVRVDLREIQSGHLDRNVLLQANDTVIVPPASRIFVSGEVRTPGAFAYSPGLTIRQAVSLAGGFTPDASTHRARIVRQVDGRAKTLKLKLDEPVLPGDTVTIQTRLF
jgi:polysaccharide export outer membrane protein